jgi:hypothetical protein
MRVDEDRFHAFLGVTPSVDELPVLVVGVVRDVEDGPTLVMTCLDAKTIPLGVSNCVTRARNDASLACATD